MNQGAAPAARIEARKAAFKVADDKIAALLTPQQRNYFNTLRTELERLHQQHHNPPTPTPTNDEGKTGE